MTLTKNQYWAVIAIGFLFIGINGFLVYNLYNDEIEFDLTCPLPKKEIAGCECFYNSFTRKLMFCNCYPTNEKLNLSELVAEFNEPNSPINVTQLWRNQTS